MDARNRVQSNPKCILNAECATIVGGDEMLTVREQDLVAHSSCCPHAVDTIQNKANSDWLSTLPPLSILSAISDYSTLVIHRRYRFYSDVVRDVTLRAK